MSSFHGISMVKFQQSHVSMVYLPRGFHNESSCSMVFTILFHIFHDISPHVPNVPSFFLIFPHFSQLFSQFSSFSMVFPSIFPSFPPVSLVRKRRGLHADCGFSQVLQDLRSTGLEPSKLYAFPPEAPRTYRQKESSTCDAVEKWEAFRRKLGPTSSYQRVSLNILDTYQVANLKIYFLNMKQTFHFYFLGLSMKFLHL